MTSGRTSSFSPIDTDADIPFFAGEDLLVKIQLPPVSRPRKKGVEKQRSFSYVCPGDLLQRIDELSGLLGVSRRALMTEAVILYLEILRRRGGRIIQAYSGADFHRMTHELQAGHSGCNE